MKPAAARPDTTVDGTLDWLQSRPSTAVLDDMGPRYSIHTDKAFGVPMALMKQLAKQIGTDHPLALALWKTGWYEARTVAALIADPAATTAEQMDHWCDTFDNWAICDTTCFNLFDRTAHAWTKVDRWADSRAEYAKRAAFALLWSLALHDRTAPDGRYTLSPRQQNELAIALATAKRLLRAATVGFEVIDPASPTARAVLENYFAELDRRFSAGFDSGAAGARHDDELLRDPLGAFVVLTSDDDTIGCGGVQHLDADTAEIKRMWVDVRWRGLGLGRRLLRSLEVRAAELGHARVVLDTNEFLLEAITMYERAGYQHIDRYNDNPYAHHWFAKDL